MAAALVVDDDAFVRDFVSRVLRREGFEVVEASGIEEGARVSSEYDGTIDIAVVNHRLRDGQGRQFVERLAKDRPETKVLRYSGYPFEELRREGAIPPEAAFIQKPFQARELIDKLRQVLGWLPERQRTAGKG